MTEPIATIPPGRTSLSLTDLIAAVAAAAVGLGVVTSRTHGHIPSAMITIGPTLGILLDRRRGGRGIVGGMAGGIAYQFAALTLMAFGIGGPWPSAVDHWPAFLAFATLVCAGSGCGMGLVAWLAASAICWAGRPDRFRRFSR